MALETFALKINGHRLTDIKIDTAVQTQEEIETMVTALATTPPIGVLAPDDEIQSISVDEVEKYVEIFA